MHRGGGAFGTLARYGLEGWVSRRARSFPWGTFVVNVSGSFLLGLLVTLLGERFAVAPWVRASLTIGFLGAYTTFSTPGDRRARAHSSGEVGSTSQPVSPSCTWATMPPTWLATIGLVFQSASVTVRPKPSRIDF